MARNKDKLEKSIVDIEREYEESAAQSEELKKEFQNIEEQAEEIVEKDTMCQVCEMQMNKFVQLIHLNYRFVVFLVFVNPSSL